MNKALLVCVLILFCTNLLSADNMRIGFCGASEFSDKSELKEIFHESNDELDIMPGLYWEVIIDNVGFGMTYFVKFYRETSSYSGIENEWYFSWIGSMDLRYHFFTKFILDPFIEFSLGCAGMVDITDYKQYNPELNNPLFLSLFSQLGIGLAVRLDPIHIGGKVVYRFMNDPPPATNFSEYPLKNFQFSLMVGFSL